MEMHQVRYFLAVARTLNFTRAAEECHVTQPSLTRAIQKLEEELGGDLFRRERALTHLTDLGRLMHPHLERTYEAAQAAKALARDVGRAEVAPLKLGVADEARAPALAAALAEVGGALPGFDLGLTGGASAALVEAALRGELDLVIVEEPAEAPERLETWTLYHQPYALVLPAAHPFMAAPEVALADLDGCDLIEAGAAAALSARCEAAGVNLVRRHRAADGASALRMVAAGMGAAVLPPDDLPPGLAARPVAGVDLGRPVVLGAIAGRRRAPAAEAFARAARARSWA